MNKEEISMFEFEKQTGVWWGNLEKHFVLISEATNEAGEKPIYLAPMANRQQLQPILDNPRLFDPAFVNAVRILATHYDNALINS